MVNALEDRLRNEVKREQTHVIRALKESGSAVFDYTVENPIFLIDGKIYDGKTSPSVQSFLKNNYKPWATFEVTDMKVEPTGLMAATVCYTATGSKEGGQKEQVIGTSAWLQEASADWKLVSHTEGKA
ncbi:hypothetical protein CYLTODRAFT_488138 [Cylindrobasidium torrendii FP15055 ss-10]|uniref:DUF4440 domain-containing protein n=1 Tax=Cylindrobasidium torrendii FP15055 ss-10 TaxID=1314674 RepID=A0A0D7BJD0_9AGAR|nr:hypothetical protein CYLTODRAFT_488138 [Cylindrobasidium torrendii FP15055 ss-10]